MLAGGDRHREQQDSQTQDDAVVDKKHSMLGEKAIVRKRPRREAAVAVVAMLHCCHV